MPEPSRGTFGGQRPSSTSPRPRWKSGHRGRPEGDQLSPMRPVGRRPVLRAVRLLPFTAHGHDGGSGASGGSRGLRAQGKRGSELRGHQGVGASSDRSTATRARWAVNVAASQRMGRSSISRDQNFRARGHMNLPSLGMPWGDQVPQAVRLSWAAGIPAVIPAGSITLRNGACLRSAPRSFGKHQ